MTRASSQSIRGDMKVCAQLDDPGTSHARFIGSADREWIGDYFKYWISIARIAAMLESSLTLILLMSFTVLFIVNSSLFEFWSIVWALSRLAERALILAVLEERWYFAKCRRWIRIILKVCGLVSGVLEYRESSAPKCFRFWGSRMTVLMIEIFEGWWWLFPRFQIF